VTRGSQSGQLLVRIHAAGVNPIDWKIRSGFLQQKMPLQFPVTFMAARLHKYGGAEAVHFESVSLSDPGREPFAPSVTLRGADDPSSTDHRRILNARFICNGLD
jgi:hypothetical protein